MLVNLIILDKSGSMAGSRMDAALEGINSLLSEKSEDLELVLLYTFSHTGNLERLFVNSGDMRVSGIHAGGSTALLDAIVEGSKLIPKGAQKVNINIFSDGEENSSHKHGLKDVTKLIKKFRKRDWLVTFAGMSEDSLKMAKDIGIRSRIKASTAGGIKKALVGTRGATLSYFANVDSTLKSDTIFQTTNTIQKDADVEVLVELGSPQVLWVRGQQ